VGLFVPPSSAAAKEPSPAERFQTEGCSLLARCGLTPPEGRCTPETSAGVPGVKYDEDRCAEPKALALLGRSPQDAESFAIYRFLGKRYRVTYLVTGELPMSAARLTFLIDDLPLAAKLLSAFRKKKYTAEYLDPEHRRFRGSREKTLSGEATRVAGSTSSGKLAYFGYGRSQLGPWRLGGQSMARFDFSPSSGGLTYSFRVVVTPDGAFVNRLMNLGLFRGLVQRRIREVVLDIEASTRDLVKGGISAAAAKGAFSPEEQKKLEAFLALP
jgi:hypothetical protein